MAEYEFEAAEAMRSRASLKKPKKTINRMNFVPIAHNQLVANRFGGRQASSPVADVRLRKTPVADQVSFSGHSRNLPPYQVQYAQPQIQYVQPTPRRRHPSMAGRLFARSVAVLAILVSVSPTFNHMINPPPPPVPPPETCQVTPTHLSECTTSLWNSLKAEYGQPGSQMTGIKDSMGKIYAWHYSQVIGAALDMAKITKDFHEADALLKKLEVYKTPSGGYATWTDDKQGNDDIYYDDNSWIALDFIQAYQQTGRPEFLDKAKQVFHFLETGLRPDPNDPTKAALIWHKGDSIVCTTAMGPAMEAGLLLHIEEAKAAHQNMATFKSPYLDFSTKIHNYLQSSPLSVPDGMYFDSFELSDEQNIWDGKVTKQGYYSYNMGTVLGAETLFYQITGNPDFLARAQRTARASLDFYAGNAYPLWHQPPAFNAIYFDRMWKLADAAPDPAFQARLKDVFSTYRKRLIEEGRNPETGLIEQKSGSSDPVGLYEPNSLANAVDQAGAVRIFSIPTH